MFATRAASSSTTALATALACVLALAAASGCAAGMSRLKSGLTGKPGIISMPNLFRMSKAKAVATLQLAGHHGDVSWDDQLCGSIVDGEIVELGEVCRQFPAPGAELTTGAPVRILIQPEDPRHGRVGETGEWHLMPDVVGMPVAQARAAVRAAGFADDGTLVDESDDRGCKPGVVCRTYPQALERGGQATTRYLTVGVDPTVRTTRPPRDEPEPATDAEPAPETPPPTTTPPESYF